MIDEREIVKAGYNLIVNNYLAARTKDSADVQLLDRLVSRLPKNSLILDAGCGAGIPITQLLSQNHRVIGIDFAFQQLVLAHKLIPQALFACQDIALLGFRPGSFDAICSYYAIIHIPRRLHSAIYSEFFNLLNPSGLIFLCLGASNLPEDKYENYLGSPMYWSHFGAETNVQMLRTIGFKILYSEIVEDASSPGSGHLFILAYK